MGQYKAPNMTAEADRMPTMEQPVPKVFPQDIERIVDRDFPPTLRSKVRELIQNSERAEMTRSILACLKNADGNLPELERQLKETEIDWRDVIASAEYPQYMSRVSRLDELSRTETEEIYKQDLAQYLEWLLAE